MLPWAAMLQVHVRQFDGVTQIAALPLAAGLIVATARADDTVAAGCELHLEMTREPVTDAAARCRGAGVAAFSRYCWNERYSMAVTARVKAENPGCLIVLGGPSVPRSNAEIGALFAAHPWLDVLVLGEGEATFTALLRALYTLKEPPRRPGVVARAPSDRARKNMVRTLTINAVAGLVVRDNHSGRLHHGPHRARLSDFSATASPYLDDTFDTLYADRPLPHAALCETNRGCPFACTFCDWGQATRSKVQELPLARIYAELNWIADRKIPYLYLVVLRRGGRGAGGREHGRRRDVARAGGVPSAHHAKPYKTGLEARTFDYDWLMFEVNLPLMTGEGAPEKTTTIQHVPLAALAHAPDLGTFVAGQLRALYAKAGYRDTRWA